MFDSQYSANSRLTGRHAGWNVRMEIIFMMMMITMITIAMMIMITIIIIILMMMITIMIITVMNKMF